LREETAYHEAGHVVVSCLFGRYPQSATIEPDGQGAAGTTHFDYDVPAQAKSWFDASDEKRQYIELRVLIALAGSIAHDIKFAGRAHDQGDELDHSHARQIIEESVSWDDDHETYFQNARNKTQSLLNEHWSRVEAIATALITCTTINRDRIRGLFCD
jgi:ATP-dependent Zn protease